MANFTDNLNLEKPLQTEGVDIDVINNNSDLIDTAVGTNTNKIINSTYITASKYIGSVGQQDDPINSEYTTVLGTQSQDTTNIKVGSEALKITEDDNVAGYLSSKKTVVYDYSILNDGTVFDSDDYFNFIAHISNAALTQDLKIIFRTDASNYFTITINTGLVTGHKTYSVLKSSAVATLSPDWINITEIEIGWTSLTSAINEFVTFNTFLPVKKDPSIAISNPFQVFGEKDLGIITGDWFIGNEFGKCAWKLLSGSGDFDALEGQNNFTNFIATAEIQSGGGNDVGFLSWKAAGETITIQVNNDELTLTTLAEGVQAMPLPIDTLDFVYFKLEKKGTIVKASAYVNNNISDIPQLSGTTSETSGILAIGNRTVALPVLYKSATITEMSHVDHSSISEFSKSTQIIYKAGAFTPNELSFGVLGIDTTNNRLYMLKDETTVYFASLT